MSIFYDANDNQLSASNHFVRHLFTGQQWYAELGLYDLRNRFYSPDIGRFLQPDPIGFRGDRSNLYRYCGNNPVRRRDPFGLQEGIVRRVEVMGNPIGLGPFGSLERLGGQTRGSLGGVLFDPAFGLTGGGGLALNDSGGGRFHFNIGSGVTTPPPTIGPPPPPPSNLPSFDPNDPFEAPIGNVEIGPVQYIFQAPPGALPNEMFNPSGEGWVTGGQISYYATFGGEYGSQTVVFANGQSAYYTYWGGGGGFGKWGITSYQGTVANIYWPSQYAGGFVGVGFSPGGAFSISPTTGGSSTVLSLGFPGGSISLDRFGLQTVWWGH